MCAGGVQRAMAEITNCLGILTQLRPVNGLMRWIICKYHQKLELFNWKEFWSSQGLSWHKLPWRRWAQPSTRSCEASRGEIRFHIIIPFLYLMTEHILLGLSSSFGADAKLRSWPRVVIKDPMVLLAAMLWPDSKLGNYITFPQIPPVVSTGYNFLFHILPESIL